MLFLCSFALQVSSKYCFFKQHVQIALNIIAARVSETRNQLFFCQCTNFNETCYYGDDSGNGSVTNTQSYTKKMIDSHMIYISLQLNEDFAKN